MVLQLAGAPYDMRGKRFLDVRLIPIIKPPVATGPDTDKDSTHDGNGSNSNSANGKNRVHSPNRRGSSMWPSALSTKKLFGSSSSSHSSSSSSHSNSPAVSSPVPNQYNNSSSSSGGNNAGAATAVETDPVALLVASKQKILFVQDLKTLIIVACDKQDSKNGMKIYTIHVPLHCVFVAFDTLITSY